MSELEEAVSKFHDALERDVYGDLSSSRGGGWVDGQADSIVAALLKAGWTPPSSD